MYCRKLAPVPNASAKQVKPRLPIHQLLRQQRGRLLFSYSRNVVMRTFGLGVPIQLAMRLPHLRLNQPKLPGCAILRDLWCLVKMWNENDVLSCYLDGRPAPLYAMNSAN